ncbi:MAG: prepilin-type N-terminal cleavage/methylation domain-containing protein [Smithella sp.]|nr:prepilin-type N-terminal cleavage/methylation domain-containing protein [Syntrophaceae bacterium]NTW77810.1 prepilin-type N-terminal cleavage/methylation domain-containing protein [Syntrophaceae bacterium]
MNNFASVAQRGFTLLEIMVSMVLICLVVVSVVQLSSANLRHLSASDDRIETLRHASEKMREVLDSDLSEDKTWHDVDDEGYSYDITVAETLNERTDALAVKFLEITVSAKYTRDNRSKQMTLKTAKLVSKANALKSQ